MNLIDSETTNLSKLPKPIWYAGGQGQCIVDVNEVVNFLKFFGFGELNRSEFIRRRNDNILEITDVKKVSKFIFNYFKRTNSKYYDDKSKFGVVRKKEMDEEGNEYEILFSKDDVIRSIIHYKWFSKKDVIYLHEFEDEKKNVNEGEGYLYTPIFRDSKDEVYTFFKNGVVKTTKDESTLIDFDTITGGYICDSSIRDQIDNIIIDKSEDKGLFEIFVEKAMSYKDDNGKWKLDEDEYESFRTIYGYMLSNYTNSGDTPAPLFVDRDSNGDKAEGGNGKSLVLKSIKEWKMTTAINGKNISEKDKFLFSGVNLDTQFVFLDDVEKDFNFNILYNLTTGDFEIERKFKDRVVINQHNKPKIALSTNYILSDTGWSTQRRQYVLEFGSFWHDYTKNQGHQVEYFFGGKRLFDDFDEKDWRQFFNFGFKCIQEFLFKGVIVNKHQNYKHKQLISQIEGVGVNDGVVDWIVDYIVRNQNELTNRLTGMKQSVIYDDFIDDEQFSDEVNEKWDSTRFNKAIWDICINKEWEYNPHKIGRTMSQKRWLTGEADNQSPSLIIIVK